MNDRQVLELKHMIDEWNLSSIEKMTICNILGSWYSHLQQAESHALVTKITLEKINKF